MTLAVHCITKEASLAVLTIVALRIDFCKVLIKLLSVPQCHRHTSGTLQCVGRSCPPPTRSSSANNHSAGNCRWASRDGRNSCCRRCRTCLRRIRPRSDTSLVRLSGQVHTLLGRQSCARWPLCPDICIPGTGPGLVLSLVFRSSRSRICHRGRPWSRHGSRCRLQSVGGTCPRARCTRTAGSWGSSSSPACTRRTSDQTLAGVCCTHTDPCFGRRTHLGCPLRCSHTCANIDNNSFASKIYLVQPKLEKA